MSSKKNSLELEILIPQKKSVRQSRVAELIKEIVAEALAQKLIDSRLLIDNFITVSKVKISPDLQNATIFVTAFQVRDTKPLLEHLNQLAPKFRMLVNKNIKLKFSPQLIFRYDDTMDNVNRVNDLLAALKD